MNEFNLIEDLANQIKKVIDQKSNKKNICLIYAFNGTGKTRVSKVLTDFSEKKTITYDVFFEDIFTWDNETYTLRFNFDNRIIAFIKDQGLENQITDNFQRLIGSKIEPIFDFSKGEVSFDFSPGDDRSAKNIKISRGEESLFIWSIYFTVLEAIISIASVEGEERETDEFDDLEYVIIDDPVSSIDDSRIITMATELIDVINASQNNRFKFLITTHHPLFYNLIFNEYSRKKGCKTTSLLLTKSNSGFRLEIQDDSPFAYHLLIRNQIKYAIETNTIEKNHFNQFRGLLEKTSTFLGYKNWYDCLDADRRKEMAKLVNMYSHGKLSDLESKFFPDDYKELFKDVFEDFILRFKWKV